MSETLSVGEILHQAEQREKDYDWLGAAESYKKALRVLSEEDLSRKGDTTERLGYALYRFAFQAESKDEFRERMHQAVLNHERTKEFYAKMSETEKAGRVLRCDAMIALAGYWLGSEAQEKKRLTAECWKITKDCLDAFEKADEAPEYVRTYNQLSTCIDLGFFFECDYNGRKKMMREAVDCGERAIKFLSKVGDPVETARAYVKTANCLEVFPYYFVDPSEREKYLQKAKDYLQKALDISEEATMLEVSTVLFGNGPGGYWGDGTNSSLSNLEKTLEYATKTRDRFIIGCTLDLLGYHTMWSATTYDDRDERLKHMKKALQYVEDAKRQFSPTSFTSPRGSGFWAEGPYLKYYRRLAMEETDPSERREFLERALKVAPEELKRAESSGYPEIEWGGHWIYGVILADLAKIVTDPEEKRGLLEKAVAHMNHARTFEQVEQPNGYNVNFSNCSRAITKSDLADLAKDHETRRSMLQEAVTDMQTSVKILAKAAIDAEKEGAVALFNPVGSLQYTLGDLCIHLHEVTQNNEDLQRAIEAFHDAAESYEKLGMKSRVAECYWRAARVYDDLDKHSKAAEDFEAAAGNYRVAAEKVPKLKDFYGDHAVYMQAWNEIEMAMHHHSRQEYDLAKQHFEKGGDLHKSLKRWSYLAPNYFAWVQVEDGEDLSRNERIEEAINAFKRAQSLFSEAKQSLEAQLSKIEDSDEKQTTADLIKAADVRQEYCMARIALEQARKMDKEGDHFSSSEKYGSAAEAFEKTYESVDSEQDKKEIRFATNLSRAWQKMTLAEAKSSPALYMEASQLFEQTEDLSPNEKTKMLVLGHSRFCRALEAGTRYADTRDQALHALAVQHLSSASNYYIRADFLNASEYAKATKLLFDAYVYMDNAERESDPDKKAKLYTMVEKVLQTSAGSFTKAEHPEKREQVLRLLEKARDERELAASLNEVMHAPAIFSTTRVLTAPTPTHEEAVGSERFEHADIQANLIIRQKELKVGEPLSVELELVNAGKGPALLVKVNKVIPEGFELHEKPETYRVEDSYIDMKGKRLAPLKTEELRLILKPKVQGTFALKPTILYLDEDGKYKSHETETVTIVVKELGIKGWIKGER